MGGRVSYEKVTLPSDCVVIVTGASTGIGYETAKNLAMMGAKVIMACRNEEKTSKAIGEMRQDLEKLRQGNTTGLQLPGELQLHYMNLDLASLKSTKKFIEEFKATGWPLHLLVCNAGLALNTMELTENNHEMMFQVNYLGHYLMIEHFLPIIQRSGEDCRIILVSSLAHGNCTFVKDDIEGKNKTKDMSFKLYSNSKGYQVMHMYSLYSRLQRRSVQNIGVFSLHPGYVQTELARDISKVFQTINIVSRKLGISINREKGAFTTLYCSVNPDLKGTSGYYDNCKLTTPSATTRNKEYQEILESYTRECLKDDLPKDGEVAGYVDTYYTDRQPTC